MFFFFNDTATTEIYTLSLHDALPISARCRSTACRSSADSAPSAYMATSRSEEHTSELQSQSNLVCRLLLEKKKKSQDSNRPTLCCRPADRMRRHDVRIVLRRVHEPLI